MTLFLKNVRIAGSAGTRALITPGRDWLNHAVMPHAGAVSPDLIRRENRHSIFCDSRVLCSRTYVPGFTRATISLYESSFGMKSGRKMKTTISAACLAVALIITGVNQASAQSVTQNAPSGLIGWSTSAPLCTKVAGSAAIAINFSAPSFVTFAPNAYGTVTLICNMPGIMNGLSWANINALAFTFSNATAGLGCGAEVHLVDRTTATPVSHWATNPYTVYNGIWTVEILQPPLPQNHTYDVEFRLHRPQSAVNSCSPVAYAGFLERIQIIR